MSDSNLLIEPLPTGWENLQFYEVCDRVKDSYQPVNGGSTPYIGLEHLAQGFPAFVGRGAESEIRSSKTAFKVGDVLFGKLRPYLRKGAQADFDGISSRDILVFRAAERCESNFLKYLIHSNEFIDYAQQPAEFSTRALPGLRCVSSNSRSPHSPSRRRSRTSFRRCSGRSKRRSGSFRPPPS